MKQPHNQTSAPAPLRAIRQFDALVEYSRRERLDKGCGKDKAKGYGIWLTKVVAAHRGRSTPLWPTRI